MEPNPTTQDALLRLVTQCVQAAATTTSNSQLSSLTPQVSHWRSGPTLPLHLHNATQDLKLDSLIKILTLSNNAMSQLSTPLGNASWSLLFASNPLATSNMNSAPVLTSRSPLSPLAANLIDQSSLSMESSSSSPFLSSSPTATVNAAEQLAMSILVAAAIAASNSLSMRIQELTLHQQQHLPCHATSALASAAAVQMSKGPHVAEEPSSSQNDPPAACLSERQQFLVFIKILFRCLERDSNQQLRYIAKAVVAECTRRHRMGDANYTPLQDAVESRLRNMVGERHWRRATRCFQLYCRKQGCRLPTAKPLTTAV